MSDEELAAETQGELTAGSGVAVAVPESSDLVVAEQHDELAHPSPFKYVMIALILCVVTGIEVSISYLEGDISDWLIVTILLVAAAVKFAMVAAYYMHLKPDRPILRRFFVLGVCAAIVLYLIVLITLHGVY
jgi:cytochrome c oxidase subunit 4